MKPPHIEKEKLTRRKGKIRKKVKLITKRELRNNKYTLIY